MPIIQHGYPAETHTVTTDDGYILTMHRIPYSRTSKSTETPRPVVFLQHGLLCSSVDWVIMGPGKALGTVPLMFDGIKTNYDKITNYAMEHCLVIIQAS
jgi:hypothetical protein